MTVKLGGREFSVADLAWMTFAQAHYLMQQARAAGIDRIWPVDGESDADYELRLRGGIIDAGNVPQVMAGYLIPAGRKWSPRLAREVASHLEDLTDPGDHATLLELSQQVAPDFFVRALDWFGIFRLSFPGNQPAEPNPTPVH